MPDIHITVRDKIAIGDRSRIVCGNSDYIAIFDFDAEWDPYDTKTARFVYAEHSGQYVDVVFTGTECPVPVLRDVIGVTVGVFAGDLHTTTPAWFECDKSILCGVGSPSDPPDDVYNQIMELIHGLGTPDEKTIAAAVAEYILAHPIQESDPTVPDWAKEEKKPSYTAADVGADPSGTAASHVSAHNTGTDTHSDIRLLIQGLTERLNALADSDDTTLDQLSEIVAYIKSNRDLIAAVTTDKVGVTDIVNDLVTNVANKPLSAAQGVALKALVDALSGEIANSQASGLNTAQVNALDGMFKVCAFTKDNVSAEYTAFKNAFGITDSGGETEVTLTSISATYDGGDVAVGTALSDLTGIVVTAHYSDGTSRAVTGYTLDGTIAEGENTVTVIYGGKMTEFVVVGVAESGGEVVMLKSITGDGASWIDTEVLPETTHRYEISATVDGYFVGCDMRSVGVPYGGFYVHLKDHGCYIEGVLNGNFFDNIGTWNITDANLLTNKQAYFVIKNGLQAIYLDADYTIQQSAVTNGTTVWGSSTNTEVPIIPIYLFRLNYSSETHSSSVAKYTPTATKFFWFKIYEDSTDELLHEFLPAKHGSKIGMYDTVTGKFHENIGTGTFAYEEVDA